MNNKEKICGIYGWFDRETGECLYVGQSVDIKNRINKHLTGLRYGRHTRKDFADYYKNKENKDAIQWAVLEETDNHILVKNMAEIKWFNFLKPKFYGVQPSKNYKSFEASEEIINIIRERSKETFEKKSNICTVCNKNKTINLDKICQNCRIEQDKIEIEKTRKINKSNNVSLDEKEIIRLYVEEEKSYREIALLVGYSHITVRNVLKRNNIENRGHGANSSRKNKIYVNNSKAKICLYCNKEFFTDKKKRKYCSRICVDNMKRKKGKEQRLISGTLGGDGLIPDKVKDNYKEILGNKYDPDELVSHARWHYGKNKFSSNCNLCLIDYPDINIKDEKWKTHEQLSELLGIRKIDLSKFLIQNKLKNNRGEPSELAKNTKDLYAIQPTKSSRDDLWDSEKIISLYNKINTKN